MSIIADDLKITLEKYADECISLQCPSNTVRDQLNEFLIDCVKVGWYLNKYDMMWLDSTRLQIDFVTTDDPGMLHGIVITLPYLSSSTGDVVSDYDRAMRGI